MNRYHYIMAGIVYALLVGCGGSESEASAVPVTPDPPEIPAPSGMPENNFEKNPEGDISYANMKNRNPDCAAYTGSYRATIMDAQQGNTLTSYLTITADENSCTFESNNIPNHDVGANTTTGRDFATRVQENSLVYRLIVPRNPNFHSQVSYVEKIAGMLTLNGILLNGVDLDMDSAFCYHPDINAPLNIGLGTRQQCGLGADWYAVPANNPDIVTLDEFTGHAFDGRYHYHGDNSGLSFHTHEHEQTISIADVDPSGSPVIGFAPDGFPIYGHYIYDDQIKGLRKVTSSWQVDDTERETPLNASFSAPSVATHPKGIFVEDWQYIEGSGDLDECNGMVDAYGNYGYYYTEQYPYGPICTKGQPDSSFVLEASAFAGSTQ